MKVLYPANKIWLYLPKNVIAELQLSPLCMQLYTICSTNWSSQSCSLTHAPLHILALVLHSVICAYYHCIIALLWYSIVYRLVLALVQKLVKDGLDLLQLTPMVVFFCHQLAHIRPCTGGGHCLQLALVVFFLFTNVHKHIWVHIATCTVCTM